jgi:putative PIN family toxin of toxin-antitoxin system
MLAVIDTNILVSSLWAKDGAPTRITEMILNGALIPCYDHRILREYRDVLNRPKFAFSLGQINALLSWIESNGQSVVVNSLNDVFEDEADRKFYEVAKSCAAILITGNLKHFPKDPLVMGVSDFLKCIAVPNRRCTHVRYLKKN